jgi:predicted DNA-binding transcriptional regulator YafY
MPKADKKTVLLRQWIMVQKIPRRPPGITAAELCAHLAEAGYPVSKRTVERDLLMRSKSGLKLACNDESPPFGWYFPPNVEAGFADLDLPEALSLRMAEETLRSLLPPAFLEALESTLPQGPQTLGIQSGECAGALAHESGTCGTYAGSAPAAYRRGDSCARLHLSPLSARAGGPLP